MSLDGYLVLSIAGALVLLTVYNVIRQNLRSDVRFDALDPRLIFLLLYLVYNCLIFLRISDLDLRSRTLGDYAFLVMLGLCGIFAGNLGGCGKAAVGAASKSNRPVSPQPLLVLSLAVCGICVVMIVAMEALGRALLEGDIFARNEANRGVMAGGAHLLPVGAALAIVSGQSVSWRLRSLVLAAIAAGMLVVYYVLASRGELLLTCILAVYLFHYNVRRIAWYYIVPAIPVLLGVMAVLGTMRVFHSGGPYEMLRSTNREVLEQALSIEHLEPYRHISQAVELLADGPPEGQFLLGSSYLRALEIIPPSVMLPWQRPATLDQWYVSTYDPETARKGGGWGFPALIEAYFNLGPVGCFLVFALASLGISALHRRASLAPQWSIARLADCLLAAVLLQFFRISFASFFKCYIFIFVLSGIIMARTALWLEDAWFPRRPSYVLRRIRNTL